VEDRKFVCPCYRHEQDIAEMGHCLCSLFVDDSYEPPDLEALELAEAQGDWPQIVVYGAPWCRDTIRTRTLLQRYRVPYTLINVEEDPEAARRVMEWNKGYLSTPTLVVDGEIVTEPSDEALVILLRLS
jgi:mycoredoxin